ncbi:hypothetical protein [Actinoplanes sp. CA-252034]|uniref:hypothetical protein n=1 Tax=Actinoplanes sp. CA-252034 TaxID=3239906 RepID=UPI003D996285
MRVYPVPALSSATSCSVTSRSTCAGGGADAVLPKPWTPQQLLAAAAALMAQKVG